MRRRLSENHGAEVHSFEFLEELLVFIAILRNDVIVDTDIDLRLAFSHLVTDAGFDKCQVASMVSHNWLASRRFDNGSHLDGGRPRNFNRSGKLRLNGGWLNLGRRSHLESSYQIYHLVVSFGNMHRKDAGY